MLILLHKSTKVNCTWRDWYSHVQLFCGFKQDTKRWLYEKVKKIVCNSEIAKSTEHVEPKLKQESPIGGKQINVSSGWLSDTHGLSTYSCCVSTDSVIVLHIWCCLDNYLELKYSKIVSEENLLQMNVLKKKQQSPMCVESQLYTTQPY